MPHAYFIDYGVSLKFFGEVNFLSKHFEGVYSRTRVRILAGSGLPINRMISDEDRILSQNSLFISDHYLWNLEWEPLECALSCILTWSRKLLRHSCILWRCHNMEICRSKVRNAALGRWLVDRGVHCSDAGIGSCQIWRFFENRIWTGFWIGGPDRIRVGFGHT